MHHFKWRQIFIEFILLSLFTISLLGCSSSSSEDRTNHTAKINPLKTSATQVLYKPSPTPVLDASGPAILGGNVGAFIAQYGPPNDHSALSYGSYNFQRYSNSTADYLNIGTDIADGKKYMQHVAVITVQSPAEGWEIHAAQELCKKFFPTDAVYKYQVVVNNGGRIATPTAITGFDVVYYSASLRSKFPASAFQDVDGNQAQAGLFDVQYLYSGNPDDNQISSCNTSIGTEGTK